MFQSLLVLAPHTDDAELGCGGAIARFLEEGVSVHVAAFSTAEESLPAGSQPGRLKREFLEAMRSFGIPDDRILVYDYPVRRLSAHRQDVLEDLVLLRSRLCPHAVFLPSGADLHQDHQVIHAEGLRAFKDLTVWGYELPWNHVSFATNAFVVLERRHLEAKWRALQAYSSQIELQRPYFSREFLEGLAVVRGAQVRAPYAEAFEVIRVRV
jgi:LmbE family N-acetylglucosaminyl deacetylase